MKKIVLALVLVLFPLMAGAQEHDTLLTPDGTLFSIDTELAEAHPELTTDAHSVLVLTTRADGAVAKQIVPASLTRGDHFNASMAYDAESKTLFVFWLRQVTLMESELLFASVDANGTWSEPAAWGRPFNYRENLQVAVTRRVVDPSAPNGYVSGISVHATWWEFDTHTGEESAQYAMLTVENGQVVSTDFLNLGDFVESTTAPAEQPELAVLKQPLLFASAKQDSVLVVFGDFTTQRLHEVRVFPTRPPVANGRLRVPVGRQEGGYPAPSFGAAANGRMEGIFGDTDRMAFFVRDPQGLHYVIMKEGVWTAERTVAFDEQLGGSVVIEALRRLVETEN